MSKATLQNVTPDFFPMGEIDQSKVNKLVEYLSAGGEVPPPVVAKYGNKLMPLDGHHRLAAYRKMGRNVEAWVIDGKKFDSLCARYHHSPDYCAEDYVDCGGVKAMDVAGNNK